MSHNGLRSGISRRSMGQTVIFARYEWLYNPHGITKSTVRQIEELSAKGEGPITVIQWPEGKLVYQDSEWLEKDR